MSKQTKAEAPWMAGLRSAKANFIPALIVQAIMLGVLLAYYFYPPTTRWLNSLADLKAETGYGFAAVAGVIAGGFIPEIMRVIVFQKGRVLLANYHNLLFTVPYWGFSGVVVDFFYRAQAGWFGSEATLGVVAMKVLVDQFLFNPLYAAPVGAWSYDLKSSGYKFNNLRRFLTLRYYFRVVVPILFATWIVWIPLVTIVYSLPSLLQIPLFALALSLWVILFTWINEARAREDQ